MSLIDEIHFENQRELEESRKNPKKLTNFEKIKQMSVEEMAIAIDKLTTLCMHPDGCNACPIHTKKRYICNSQDIMNWLENEVSE